MANSLSQTGISAAAKLRLVLLAAVLGIAGGTIGFIILEDMTPLEALYMTMITVSTVGFGEVAPLHPGGRIFVIFLIIFGVMTLGSIATFVGESMLEGQFRHLVARRKMEAKLKKMSNHYVIAGFGRVGQHVAHQFVARKVPFVIIERDEKNVERILKEGFIPVVGDATDDDVLEKAGVRQAHTLVSTLPDEAQNVYLALTARHMNPKLRIIARADFEEGEKKLLRAGADHVVIPHVLGGIRMANAALQPHVVDFMQMAAMGGEGLALEELVLPKSSPLAGTSLAKSNLKQRYGISLIGIKQQGRKMNINPGADTVLQPEDVMVLIGKVEDLERFSHDLSR